MKVVLVTGATGFVGSEIVRHLLARADVEKLILPIRPSGGEDAAARFARIRQRWQKFSLTPVGAVAKVVPVDWDLSVQLSRDVLSDCRAVDTIIHSAASTAFDLPLSQARTHNLVATLKLLHAAKRMPALSRFVHLSTAFVAGDRRGVIVESDCPGPFRNSYERTKYEAELAVRSADLPYTIMRPSIIVGDSGSGYVVGIKVLYSVLRLWLSGILPRAPLDATGRIDIVPIDYVVRATLASAVSEAARNETLHVTAGAAGVDISRIVAMAMATFAIPEPRYVPIWFARLFCRWPFSHLVDHNVSNALDLMQWHIPYLSLKGRSFDDHKIRALLASRGEVPLNFEDYGPNMFRFVKESAWGRKAAALETKSLRTA